VLLKALTAHRGFVHALQYLFKIVDRLQGRGKIFGEIFDARDVERIPIAPEPKVDALTQCGIFRDEAGDIPDSSQGGIDNRLHTPGCVDDKPHIHFDLFERFRVSVAPWFDVAELTRLTLTF